jgi:uncharacterized protein
VVGGIMKAAPRAHSNTARIARLGLLTLALLSNHLDRFTADGASLQPDKSALPELTEPVNDFARIIDQENTAVIDRMIRTLKAATGDVVVVATVPTIEPFGDIREYANKLFENHGRGIGERGKDNGLLIVVALAPQRRIQIEVGYELEQWITDGFSGETIREFIRPAFREGRYGDGLRVGTSRIIGRIAQGRGVTLDGVRVPREPRRNPDSVPFSVIFLAVIILLALSRIGRGPRGGYRSWGGGGWSGWSSGVGPFGGGWGSGGGGFGGGFGGFGGGRSGGGGGGSDW